MTSKTLSGAVSALAILWATATAAAAQVATPSTDDPGQASPVQPSQSAAAPAPAQAPADEIVVTGIRASLASALQAKRTAPNIQEDLSADDIGKLPDNNIAESLARLPGLSTNRDRGNATQISIRGMGPELVNTLLNGRELVAAGPDRNIRYDQYPAELINGASVYKSPLPSQIEGAIAGQVDLKTVRPLDYKKSEIVLNGRAEYNDLAQHTRDTNSVGWIGSASYIGQFADRTVGVSLGITARDEPVATQRTNIYRYTNSFADLNGDGIGNDNVPYGFEALQRGGSDKRIGGLATIQWKPDNALEVNGDFFYSRVKYAETQRGFSAQGLPFGNTFSNVTVTDGGAVAGTATNFANYGLQVENNNQYYTFTDTLYAGGLNAKYNAGRWHFNGDFGYSYTKRNALFLNIYTEAVNPGTTTTNTNGLAATYLSQPGQPSAFGFNQSLTDPTLNYVSNLEIPSNGNGAPIIHDELYSGKGDVSYDVDGGFLSRLNAGVRYTTRSKDLTQRTQYGSVANRAALPASLVEAPLNWSGPFTGLPQSLTFDVFGVANQLFGGIHPTESVFDQQSSWRVDERTYAGYAEADFDRNVFGMQLTGNLGVRVVRTEETSSGTQVNGTGVGAPVLTPVVYHNNFTDVLPSLNATLHIDSHQQVRLALSKAIARAPLDFLNASFGLYNGGSGAPAAFGGNPALKPYRADQADLTYEHYFNKDTALTLSLFYKNLDTFIVQQVTSFPTIVNGVAQTGTFTQPVNGNGGNVRGLEVLFQQAFSFLPRPLDGLGIYANYSYTDSAVNVKENDNSIGTIPLPGLSKNVYNVSLYYSKYGVDARVGYRYRSSFATQTGDTDRILFNHSEGVLSSEISYEFPSASVLHGLKLTVQADNLTDTPYQLYYGKEALQGRYELFGRRFYGGATYRF